MATASLTISIWNEDGRPLPPDMSLLSEALAPHLEHVRELCEQGYVEGQIVDDAFRGWWRIKRED